MHGADFTYHPITVINIPIHVRAALHAAEFVKIAKDAKKGLLPSHLLFSDIWDHFTAQFCCKPFFFPFFFFPRLGCVTQWFFYKCNYRGRGGWGEELRKKVDKFFQLSWSHNWFCQITKMLEMLPLYLKLLREIVSVSKINLGLETWVVCHVRHISCSSSLLFERRSESTLAIC